MFGVQITPPDTQQGPVTMVAVNGFSDLKQIQNPRRDEVRILKYGDLPGDNLGGKFVFDDTSLLTESLPNIVRPNNVPAWMPGRFLRL
jgi:hypothetical protein